MAKFRSMYEAGADSSVERRREESLARQHDRASCCTEALFIILAAIVVIVVIIILAVLGPEMGLTLALPLVLAVVVPSGLPETMLATYVVEIDVFDNGDDTSATVTVWSLWNYVSRIVGQPYGPEEGWGDIYGKGFPNKGRAQFIAKVRDLLANYDGQRIVVYVGDAEYSAIANVLRAQLSS